MAPPRQASQLLRTGKAQHRHALARLELRIRQHLAQQRRRRLGAEEHGLVNAAGMKDAVCEDMATLAVTGELHLVDGDEIEPLRQTGSSPMAMPAPTGIDSTVQHR